MINWTSITFAFFIVLIGLGVSVIPSNIRADRIMVVQLKEAQIRTAPSFLGKIMTRMIYGDMVKFNIERKG